MSISFPTYHADGDHALPLLNCGIWPASGSDPTKWVQKADETNAEIERRGWSDEAREWLVVRRNALPTISEAKRVPLYHDI